MTEWGAEPPPLMPSGAAESPWIGRTVRLYCHGGHVEGVVVALTVTIDGVPVSLTLEVERWNYATGDPEQPTQELVPWCSVWRVVFAEDGVDT